MKTDVNTAKSAHKSNMKNIFRFAFFIIGVLLISSYHILKGLGLSKMMYYDFAKPVHSFLVSLCDHTSVCVGEVLIGIYALILLIDIIAELVNITKQPAKTLLSILLIICASVSIIYGGFCMLWGFYYAAPGVSGVCKITTGGVEHDDLVATDRFFLEKANEYSEKVTRDSNGLYIMSDATFEHSLKLYENVCVIYPGLEDKVHRPKKVFFSKAVSLMDFTGFFFPFTGEACINVDSPDCMIPSTIAHELAHQRGIAAEDEANFIGILACMEDGDPDYVYSASLLALAHLQSAVYKSGDMDAWQQIKDSYEPGVKADLSANSEYWSAYRKNPVNRATSQTYDAFLKSYDQSMGLQTYGACVDYLVYYYGK